MEIREIRPGADEALARSLLRVQRAAYSVEAALIGDDRIPPLRETLDEMRAAPLRWLGAFTGQQPAGQPTAAQPRAGQPTARQGRRGERTEQPTAGQPTAAQLPAGHPATDGAGGGRLVGAVAWAEDPSTVDVDRLVVDPVAHRRGVGRALVDAVLTRAGGRAVVVATGRANRPARALYESFGFRVLGDAEPVPGLWITRYGRP